MKPKAIAFVVGMALAFILPITIGYVLGDETPFFLPLLALPYGVSGLVLGFLWPHMSWRLGLWLFIIWPPMFLFALFLSGESLISGPVDWKGMLRDLLGYSLILVAGSLGGWLGSIIKRHRPSSPPRHEESLETQT